MLHIVKDYKKLVYNIDAVIKDSGYRTDFICKELGLPKTTFYAKKKMHTFSLDEMEKLLTLIDSERLEDRYFARMLKEAEQGEYLSDNESEALFNS